jgi:ABC-type lipoprotein export system ATPase subunit
VRIAAEGIEFRYGDRIVLSGLDLDVPAGEVGILVGPSGSGKSTLLALLAGLRSPARGRVRLVPDRGAWRRPDPSLVAWVPQGLGSLRSRTALDNVAIGVLARGAPLRHAIDLARESLEHMELGDRADDPCGRLSGGEQQRVAFARALVMQRPLLFADEPTSNLDARSTARVIDSIGNLRGRTTVVIATHDPALMALSPHRVELRHGPSGAAR